MPMFFQVGSLASLATMTEIFVPAICRQIILIFIFIFFVNVLFCQIKIDSDSEIIVKSVPYFGTRRPT